MAELKDPVQEPSVEIVEIVNQKPQAGQATITTYKPTPQLVSVTQQDQLPETGSKENTALFAVASVLIATSSGLFLLKKKEE